ncbi:MAG UNVERIFIED_CONTAM: hypothetical protein LVT10_10215 [Anaerolineae bacterium]
MGVVYSAVLNEMYTAIRGGGAFRNGQPIRAKHNDDLAQAVILTSIRSGRIAPPSMIYNTFKPCAKKCAPCKRLGRGRWICRGLPLAGWMPSLSKIRACGISWRGC